MDYYDLIMLEELLSGAALIDAMDAAVEGKIDTDTYISAVNRAAAASATAAAADLDCDDYY
jgi:hypothetical protein